MSRHAKPAEVWHVPECVVLTRRAGSSGSKVRSQGTDSAGGTAEEEEEDEDDGGEEVEEEIGSAEGESSESVLAALAWRSGAQLTAVHMDTLTLEFVPQPVEEAYRRRVFHQWLPLFLMSMLLSVFICISFFARMLQTGMLDGWLQVLPSLWLACAFCGLVACMLALLPGQERTARAAALAAELLFAATHPAMLLLGGDKVQSLARIRSAAETGSGSQLLYDGMWPVLHVVKRWYLVQDAWLMHATHRLVLLFLSPVAASRRALGRACVQQLVQAAALAAMAAYERRQRRRFLARVAGPQPCGEKDAVRAALAAARRRWGFPQSRSDGLAAAWAERLRRAAATGTKRRAYSPADGQGGAAAAVGELHFHIRGLGPLQVPAQLRAALAAALAAQGFALRGSGVMDGSLRLVMLYGSYAADELQQRAPPLDVEELLSHLLRTQPQLRSDLLSDTRIQHGAQLFSIRNGEVVNRQPARAPEVVDLYPRVLPAGVQAELALQLRLRKPQPPERLFIVLRHAGGSTAYDVPCTSWQDQGPDLTIVNTVLMDSSGKRPLDVALLQVFDGEVFSEAVPVLSCRSPQLFRELKGLDKFLARRPEAPLSSTGFVWAMKSLASFSASAALHGGRSIDQQSQLDCPPAAAQPKGTGSLPPPELLAAAAGVWRTAPHALHLACLLGLPLLAELLLQDAPLAFLLLQQQQQQQQQRQPQAGSEAAAEPQIVMPLPATSTGRDPRGPKLQHDRPVQALNALLQAAGACSMWQTTLLHLAVVSESSATVRALQAGVRRWGAELNWDAEGTTLTQVGGFVGLSAMALAAQRLPRTGRVARQALLGGGTRAAASWIAAADGGHAGARKASQRQPQAAAQAHAQAVRSWELNLTALAQSSLSQQGRHPHPPSSHRASARRLAAAAAYLLASSALHLLPSGLPLAASWPRILASIAVSTVLRLAAAAAAPVLRSAEEHDPQALPNMLFQVAGCCSPLNMPWDAYCSAAPAFLATVFFLHHVIMPALAPLPTRSQVATTLLIVAVRPCMCMQLRAASLEFWQGHAALGAAALGAALVQHTLMPSAPPSSAD